MMSSSRLLLLAALIAAPTWAFRDLGGNEADLAVETEAETEAEVENVAEAEVESSSGTGLQAGSLVLARYELISVLTAWPTGGVQGYSKVSYLGKGAFGETWLAREVKTKEEVAIKFFYRPGRNGAITLLNMGNANYQEKAELRTAGDECDLPAKIVKAKSTPAGADRFALCLKNKVNDPQYAHLVLQVAGTQDLDGWMKTKRRTLSGKDATRIAKMMLEALAQMEGKYVHRDIKPANIMVYEVGGKVYLRVIDFGLVVKEGTSQNGVAGTPMFMPPELWPVVPRVATFTSSFDVYSTGETLYWLICGETFHEKVFNSVGARGEKEIQRALLSNDPSRLCRPSSAFSDLFDLVVGKMLQASSRSRSKASTLLADPIFSGIDTTQGESAPQEQIGNQNKPVDRRPVVDYKPKPTPVKPPVLVKEAPKEPTFLEMCHDSKAFWFNNVPACCLRERYDPKREAVCQRPCGPKVGYQNGQCANSCQATSAGQFEFSIEKSCCVATVWRTKCIYPDIASGEGWRWMKDESL